MQNEDLRKPASVASATLNRAALLTAPGTAAIAVIRLIGPNVDTFLARHFSKPTPIARCVHGLLRDGDKIIDDALAVRFADWVDLNLHGGSFVVQSVLQLAKRDGFETADDLSGEDAGDIWNEVLAALPLARTEQAVRLLLAQPAAWARLPDDPVEIRHLLDDASGRWLINIPTVAIIGPANVGKSTLANQLFGQTRSITADLPGTTRDWVGEIANIDGLAVMLLDTPGQRATDDPIEHAAIVVSREQIRSADLVVLVLDQSKPLESEMLASNPGAIVVANKADAPPQWNAGDIHAICTVATIGQGVDQLRKAICDRFGFDANAVERLRWWTDRQRGLLKSRIQ